MSRPTGGYERLLVESLQIASIAIAVVNPRRIRDFAKGVGADAETDPIDAKVGARYGEGLHSNRLNRTKIQWLSWLSPTVVSLSLSRGG